MLGALFSKWCLPGPKALSLLTKWRQGTHGRKQSAQASRKKRYILCLAHGKQTVSGKKIAPCGGCSSCSSQKQQFEQRRDPSCGLCPDTPVTTGESSQHTVPAARSLQYSNQVASVSEDLQCPCGQAEGVLLWAKGKADVVTCLTGLSQYLILQMSPRFPGQWWRERISCGCMYSLIRSLQHPIDPSCWVFPYMSL